MACDLSTGRSQACKSVGGLKHIELANYNSGGATFSADGSIATLVTSTTFYKYDLRGANNTIDEVGESSRDNNSAFYTISGTIQLPYQDEDTRQELETVAKTRVFLITEDFNGVRKLYGLDDGLDVSIGANSGANMGDFNGYSLTFSGINTQLAQMVDGATGVSLAVTQITPN